MLVHRCDRCCVYKKEIKPCRAKYRGIWAILMHKMMFPSESCNSANSVRFLLSRKCSPCVPPEPLRVPLGVRLPQFGNRRATFMSLEKGRCSSAVWEPMQYSI